MEHNEPWQIFADNGLPVDDRSGTKDNFSHDKNLVMGGSHVWVWRRAGESIEVMLQTRSKDKKTWPGFMDISAAGHIDADENAIQSAVRESKEEIGLDVDPSKLFFIFSLRTPLDFREIDWVFLYESDNAAEFRFNDGEVESIEWIKLDVFNQMVMNPDDYNIVPQGNEYFNLLIHALKRVT